MTTKKESKPYFITEEVFSQIRESIGSCIPETGGILGSSDGKHIDYFYFDKTANVTGATYEPDCNELNPVIRRWHEKGIEFVGFIHSHPRGAIKPSNPDNLYSHAISYVSPGIMQGLIDAAMSGDSLTVRSFKSVIEGYLAPVFARAEVVENRTYRLEGTLEEPQMIAENRAR